MSGMEGLGHPKAPDCPLPPEGGGSPAELGLGQGQWPQNRKRALVSTILLLRAKFPSCLNSITGHRKGKKNEVWLLL